MGIDDGPGRTKARRGDAVLTSHGAILALVAAVVLWVMAAFFGLAVFGQFKPGNDRLFFAGARTWLSQRRANAFLTGRGLLYRRWSLRFLAAFMCCCGLLLLPRLLFGGS